MTARRDASAIATVCAEHGAKLVRRARQWRTGRPARNAALAPGRHRVRRVPRQRLRPAAGLDRRAGRALRRSARRGGGATHRRAGPLGAVRRSISARARPGSRPLTRVAYVPTAALVVRRAALGGGFDETMRYGEDVDLVWRLVEAGHRVRYEPAVQVAHTAPAVVARAAAPALSLRHERRAADPASPGAVAPLVRASVARVDDRRAAGPAPRGGRRRVRRHPPCFSRAGSATAACRRTA